MHKKLMRTGFILLLLLLASSFIVEAIAQDAAMSKKEKKEWLRKKVAEMVETRQYKIQVQQAHTMRGRQVNLTGGYGMIVAPERVQCDLPYFGQSFSGSGYGTEAGVKLDSKDFTYENKPAKKGGWDITITPKDDTRDIRTVILNISTDGYISLNFTFNARTMMRYSGLMVVEEK